jgi:hypothetical protein
MRLFALLSLMTSFACSASEWSCFSSIQKVKGTYVFSVDSPTGSLSISRLFAFGSGKIEGHLSARLNDSEFGKESKTGQTSLYLYNGKNRTVIDIAYLRRAADPNKKAIIMADLTKEVFLRVMAGDFVNGSISFDKYEFALIEEKPPNILLDLFSIETEAQAEDFSKRCN